MSGMGLIVAAAFGLGMLALIALLWMIGSGQYEDLQGDAERILLDDENDSPL